MMPRQSPATMLALGAALLLVTACAIGVPGRQPDPAWPGVVDPATIPLAELGQLPVFITDLTTDGRNLHVRGLVGNPYAEPVDGVRLIFRAKSRNDPNAQVLDAFQKVMDVDIASGSRASLRWDVQTMYANLQGGGFDLAAFAIKRGGAVLPLPPGWKEK